MVFVNKPQYFM